MKELKMFPQITEETEENLLNLEEIEPPSKSSGSDHKKEECSSPNDTTPPSESVENCDQCILPKITCESTDMKNKALKDEFSSPPPRTRMRSLSGGAYRLAPHPASGRMRRQSGDDVLSGVSPMRKAALFDAFRPRSKSDSKSKRPTFLTTLKNSMQNTFFHSSAGNSPARTSPECELADPFHTGECRQRPRSGSDSKGGPMSKVIEMFRGRSNSMSADNRSKQKSAALPNQSAVGTLNRRYSVDPDCKRAPVRPFDDFLECPYDLLPHEDKKIGDIKAQLLYTDTMDENLYYATFYDSCRCYSLIPLSAKLVVLDTKLLVKKAFLSLLVNNIRAAPLWDSSKHQYVGMLTITDFINILRHYYNFPEKDVNEIEEHRIEDWQEILGSEEKRFVSISPEAKITEAIKIIAEQKVHRLPVVDEKTSNVLYIITHRRILKYLSLYLSEIPKPSFMSKSVGELKIGTLENLAVVTPEMTVIEALNLFIERRVSSLPVIENEKIVDLYAKFDVFALAKESTYVEFDMTIKKALDDRSEVYEGFLTCTLDDTLDSVMQKIVNAGVHRIVVIDKNFAAIGIISLSDLMKFLVLRPLGLMEKTSIEEAEDSLCKLDLEVSDDIEILEAASLCEVGEETLAES